jgi:hypothetical protein
MPPKKRGLLPPPAAALPPPPPLTFLDLPRELRQRVLFDVMKVNKKETIMDYLTLARFSLVSYPHVGFRAVLLLFRPCVYPSSTPSKSLSSVSFDPFNNQVCKEMRQDIVGLEAAPMWRSHGFYIRSASVGSLCSLSSFLSAHAHNFQPSYIGKNKEIFFLQPTPCKAAVANNREIETNYVCFERYR